MTRQSRMTPRERVLAALNHRQPDRVPFSWQFCATEEMQARLTADLAAMGLDWQRLRQASEDILGAAPASKGPAPSGGMGFWDVWGIRWKPAEYGGGTYHEIGIAPLADADTIAAVDAHPWPDPTAFDFDGMRKTILAANPDRRLAVKYMAGNPLETYSWMTGIEKALLNLVERPEVVVRALEHITGFYEAKMARSLATAGDLVDIVFCFDDLGSQHGPLMSREMYRRLIQPFHRRLFSAAKRAAPHAKVMMHSDGDLFDLLDDLVEAGLEVLEAVQVDCPGMSPRRLKDAFRGRLAFHGAISVQQLLPKADAETVRRECRMLIDVLGDGGGYVAAPSHAIQVGTPTENVLAMLQEVLGADDYSAAVKAARL